uniref:EGF-like domain-containing protein n=1 Tax=Elaeophora elaphi TaxID=1147741 RepID=A0A0R3RJC6_9BILA
CSFYITQNCNNGSAVGGKCVCISGYSGTYCNRIMHCKSSKLRSNGSCFGCSDGWEGANCDQIQCIHGVPDEVGQNCICDIPYSGQFCKSLETADVYSYYNHKVYKVGPIGVLSILPLIIILFGCERTARSRRIKRVEEHLYGQNIIVNRHMISTILNTKPKNDQ